MKTTRLFFAACVCVTSVFGGYTYDYPNLLSPPNNAQWTKNAGNTLGNNSYVTTQSGGSIIFNPTLPAPSNNYEVRYTIRLVSNSINESFLTYLRATSNAEMVTGNTGTFYAVEIQKPTYTNGVCAATLNFHKQTGLNTLTTPYSMPIACHDGMVVRTIMLTGGAIAVFIDNIETALWTDTGTVITSGQPGLGINNFQALCYISTIDIGHLDTVAPNAVNAQTVGTSSFRRA